MAQITSPHSIGTRPGPVGDTSEPAVPREADDSAARGLVAMGTGALAVVVAVLPSLGIVALLLAGLAIGAGVPVMRRGPGASAFPFARVGVALGMIGVLLGFISLAMQLLG